jgi:YidC/Oxa1 family membrane protein insertase
MDKKRTIIAMAIMMAVVFLWTPTINWIGHRLGYDTRPPVSQQTTPATQPATNPSTTRPTVASAAPGTAPTPPSMSAAPNSAPGLAPVPATQTSPVEIGSAATSDPTYTMAIRLVPEGAGVSSVVLNDYKMHVTGEQRYIFQEPYPGHEAESRPLATRAISLNGTLLDISKAPWQLVESSPASATYALQLDASGAPVARLVKSFQLPTRKDADLGYEVVVTQKVENLTDKPIEIAIVTNGPTTPPRELDRGSDRSIIGGYENGNNVYLTHQYIEQFSAKSATKDFTKADKNDYPLLWFGTTSVYFNALVRPEPLDPKAAPSPQYVKVVQATLLNPEAEGKSHDVGLTFETSPQTIAANASLTLPSRVFFGPKKRELLNAPFYASFPRGFNSTLVLTSGICAVCTFQWLINVLVWMLNIFHFALRDWGLAIIALVVIVRLLLHPITKKSQVNMAQMSKFQPEMERIKKKYADDKDELNRQMMLFWKEHGASPVLGCLPMFLQMPIWIALWSALQSTFALRHAPFLWGYTWIKDLSQPDHLLTLREPVTIFGLIPISGLNILPILMGVTFFIQQKYFTPKPATMTPEQEQQQKMMQWMSVLLFPLMLYGGPSGLNLYIFTSTLFGIIESKRIRDHIKEREEAEKAGKVIVDAGKKFGGGGGQGKGARTKPEKGAGGLGGWLSNLQQKAEQLTREADRAKRRKA